MKSIFKRCINRAVSTKRGAGAFSPLLCSIVIGSLFFVTAMIVDSNVRAQGLPCTTCNDSGPRVPTDVIQSSELRRIDEILSRGFGGVSTDRLPSAFGNPMARPIEHHFEVETEHLEDTQLLLNCLEYATCRPMTDVIQFNGPPYRRHVYVDLTEAELDSVLAECPAAELRGKISIDRKDPSIRLPVRRSFGSPILGHFAYRSRRVALAPNPLSAEFYPRQNTALQSFMRSNNPEAAIQDTVAKAGLGGLATNQLEFRYAACSARNFSITTEPKTNQPAKVSIGYDFLGDTASLLHGIRHEAEHAGQFKRRTECRALGFSHSVFEEHLSRERSAHFNDALNAPFYCGPDVACIEFRKKFALTQIQKKYRRTGIPEDRRLKVVSAKKSSANIEPFCKKKW